LLENLHVEHVADKIGSSTGLTVDRKRLFAGVGEELSNLAPNFAGASDHERPGAAQPARASTEIDEVADPIIAAQQN